MKHLKKYNESTQEFGLIDIINILQDSIDEYPVVIYSATGFSYSTDINSNLEPMWQGALPASDTFKFKRYKNDTKRSFKFRVDFKKSKNYSELVSFLDEMNVSVARFNDFGFYLQNVEVGENKESDVYDSHSVQFSFES
jgi:hypothetical protein